MEDLHVLAVCRKPDARRLWAEASVAEGIRVSVVAQAATALCVLEHERVAVLLADLEVSDVDDDFVQVAANIQPLLKLFVLAGRNGYGVLRGRLHAAWARYLAEPETAEEARSILAAIRRNRRARGGARSSCGMVRAAAAD